MAFNFDASLTAALESVNISEDGVSFVGTALKWEDDAPDLIEAMDRCAQLTFLNLEGNTLGVKAAEKIGEALKQHPEFKRALLKDLFTGRMKTEIPLALKAIGAGITTAGAQLTVLDCSDNALGPNGMTGLVDLLKSRACYSLQELKLNNCGLGITGGRMLADALSSCIESSVLAGTPFALRVFIAGRNRLENDGAKALAKVFASQTSLEEVAMPQNGIYYPGITELSKAFSLNPNMRVLNLNDNTVREKGAAALADAMLCMPELTEINLGDCLLKTSGAIFLAQALADGHEMLENLNLGYNEIGPNGGLAVVNAMANKSRLKSLVLDANQFGSSTRAQITEILETANLASALTLEEDDSCGEEEDEDEDENEDDGEGEEESDDSNGPYSGQDEDGESDGEYVDEEGEEEEDDDDEDAYESKDAVRMTINSRGEEKGGLFASLSAPPTTAESFVNSHNPTVAMFEQIPAADKLAEIRKYLKSLTEDDYFQYLVFATLNASSLSLASDDALHVSNALYLDAAKHAEETQQVSRLRTFFLIQLGLLNCEDKSFKPKIDRAGCRHGLQSAIKQAGFPDALRSTFQLFLDRAN